MLLHCYLLQSDNVTEIHALDYMFIWSQIKIVRVYVCVSEIVGQATKVICSWLYNICFSMCVYTCFVVHVSCLC